MKRYLLPPWWSALLAAGVGLLTWSTIGYVVRKENGLLQHPQTEAWRCLIAAEFVLWAFVCVAAIQALRKLGIGRDYLRLALSLVAIVVAYAGIETPIVMARLCPGVVAPLPSFEIMGAGAHLMAGVTIIGGIVAVLPALVVCRVYMELTPPPGPDDEALIEHLVEYRDLLQLSLLALSGMIVVATAATASVRNVITSFPEARFPPVYVLAYGVYFSALLAILYAPAFILLQATTSILIEKKAPITSLVGASWREAAEHRKVLQETLNLSVGEGIQTVVTVLSPLFTSVIAIALGK